MSSTATATPDHVIRGEALEFIGHGDGGPTVIVPNVIISAYHGTDGDHYERVCDHDLVMPFEGHELLVLQEEGSTAWIPDANGGLLLRWVGADSGAALLAAVDGQAFAPATKNGAPVVWTVPAGGQTFMHAVEDGRDAKAKRDWDSTELDLPAGRYSVEELADGEWNGAVTFPDGHAEDVMMQCYRLRRL